MLQVQEMTREEKVKMYNKLSKKEIIELLLNGEDLINQLATPPYQITYPTYPTYPDHSQPYYTVDFNKITRTS